MTASSLVCSNQNLSDDNIPFQIETSNLLNCLTGVVTDWLTVKYLGVGVSERSPDLQPDMTGLHYQLCWPAARQTRVRRWPCEGQSATGTDWAATATSRTCQPPVQSAGLAWPGWPCLPPTPTPVHQHQLQSPPTSTSTPTSASTSSAPVGRLASPYYQLETVVSFPSSSPPCLQINKTNTQTVGNINRNRNSQWDLEFFIELFLVLLSSQSDEAADQRRKIIYIPRRERSPSINYIN